MTATTGEMALKGTAANSSSVRTGTDNFPGNRSEKAATERTGGGTKLTFRNKFNKITTSTFLLYENYLYPHLENFRGFTRLRDVLEKLAIKSHRPRKSLGFKATDIKQYKHCVVEPEAFKKFYSIVNPRDTVLDIGAYRGFYSLVACAQGAEVYSFEMSETNVSKFQENLRLNDFDNIEVFQKPVWSEEKEIEYEEDNHACNQVGRGSSKVQAVALDSFLSGRISSLDVVKIDVEGAEMHVLKGAESLIEEHQPEILIEIHEGTEFESFEHTKEDVVEFLEKRDYSIEFLDSKREIFASQKASEVSP